MKVKDKFLTKNISFDKQQEFENEFLKKQEMLGISLDDYMESIRNKQIF